MTIKKCSISKNIYLLLKIISYFIFIDLLFFPYIHFFTIPFSLPLVLLSLLFLVKLKKENNHLNIIVLIYITVLISTFISVNLGIPSEFIVENLKRALQFLTTFAYFLFFFYVFREVNLNLKPILISFLLYLLVLLGIFIYQPNLYLKLKNIIYPQAATELGEFLFFLRFDYMFQDPNTAGYFILLVVFFALLKVNFNFFVKSLFVVLALLTVITTKSVGASLSLFIFLTAIFLLQFKKKRNDKVSIRKFLFICLFISIISVTALNLYYNGSQNSTSFILEDYLDRLEMSGENNESRIVKYLSLTQEFYPFIFGSGYTLIGEGVPIKPHNDHLRIIYSYGIICYILTIYLFFRKVFTFNSILLIPAFIAFSVNTLIDEQKLFALFLIILAHTYVYSRLEQNHKVKEVQNEYPNSCYRI